MEILGRIFAPLSDIRLPGVIFSGPIAHAENFDLALSRITEPDAPDSYIDFHDAI